MGVHDFSSEKLMGVHDFSRFKQQRSDNLNRLELTGSIIFPACGRAALNYTIRV
jgi:hypothetical protein